MSSEASGSDGITVTSEVPELPKTQPVPDPAYLALFNDYINTFFSLDYLENTHKTRQKRRLQLYPSKVTIDRAFYKPKEENNDSEQPQFGEDDIETNNRHNRHTHSDLAPGSRETGNCKREWDSLPGTVWTADEKETFFRCLARYSIHNIDSFTAHLPRKTQAEISQYYRLLRRELHQLETYKEHVVGLRNRGEKSQDTVSHCYTSKTFESGATYAEIPIACELSTAFIDYEVQQSKIICAQEYEVALRRERLVRKQIMAKHGYTVGGVSDRHEFGVISTQGLLRLQKIYRASLFAENVGDTQVRVFRFDTTVMLNEFVRQRVRDIIGELVVLKGMEGITDGPPLLDFSESGELYRQFASAPHREVARADVYRACETLTMFEIPASGFHSKNTQGKTPVLDTYWQHLPVSLNIESDGSTVLYAGPPEVKIYRQNELPYEEKDSFASAVENQNEKWDYDDEVVDFTARGHYEENEENSPAPATGIGRDKFLILRMDVDALPGAHEPPMKTLDDALVEELLFIKETETLEAHDAKHDLMLHNHDTRDPEIKRRKLDAPIAPDSEGMLTSGMWQSSHMDNFGDASLRRSWSKTFPRY